MKQSVWVVFLFVMLGSSFVYAQDEGELVVFAAASLTEAYESIGAAFEAENPGVSVLFNFGGSSTLAAQLVQGAPADVFASANDAQMQIAIEEERVVEPVQVFANNRLVLVTPIDNPAAIRSLQDLANPGLRLIVAAPQVPVRAYTDRMLERLVEDPAFGVAYRDAVVGNIVSEEPNVRQVAAKIALGEADAGVIYLSDVTPDIADDVLMFNIPDEINVLAAYPIAVTSDTKRPELATRFVDFVLSDDGQAILAEWKFAPACELAQPNTSPAPADNVYACADVDVNPQDMTLSGVNDGSQPPR